MEKGRNKLIIILVSIIILLATILGYGVYTGFKVKTEINFLNNQVTELTAERDNLSSQLDELLVKYNMLKDDVFQLKKSCITKNACEGHFPGVRWNCNNVGDEVNDPSHICVCDDNCNMNATAINQPASSGY